MYKYGIVVIGYKHLKRINRLLNRINEAVYGEDKLLLIISIDYSEDSSVALFAQEYEWKHGKKVVKAYDKNLGLRNHILKCGDYIEEFDLDALIVFEDDTFPALDYYQYAKAATEFYIENNNIAGISLYAYCKNLNADAIFEPLQNENDAYFLQYAQSWGQVWFKNQWREFKEWYHRNFGEIVYNENIPENLYLWGENSWLKYHIKYCIDMNKYFVYPYISHSTCFNDIGVHSNVDNTIIQVPLSQHVEKKYVFPEFSEQELKYNAFFENERLAEVFHINKNELLVDLYGMRYGKIKKRYLLSSKKLDYTIIKSWGNKLRPHELNIMYDIEGDSFFLYDMEGNQNSEILSKKKEVDKFFEYFHIMDKWLKAYEKENFETIRKYFIENSIYTVAIYGYGVMGRHLHNILKQINIEVKYVIDKNLKKENSHLSVVRPEEELVYVDMIIVSLVSEFSDIKRVLQLKYKGKIISLSEL